MADKNTNYGFFVPNDSRVPRMMIPKKDCPKDFFVNPHHFASSLFMAEIDSWPPHFNYPRGRLKQHLGSIGDIEAETKLIMMENEIDETEFPDEAYLGIPGVEDTEPWCLPQEELTNRRDFRSNTVFTIDPATARDLDDALSVKELDETNDNGKKLFEVGVHIADVSYFLREDMPLDQIARVRTTSVYLVQRVVPMLPRILCEKHCSLTPGEDKLTFSVVYKMDEDGKIYDQWFGRTLINSW